jgi:hypothetical protein
MLSYPLDVVHGRSLSVVMPPWPGTDPRQFSVV